MWLNVTQTALHLGIIQSRNRMPGPHGFINRRESAKTPRRYTYRQTYIHTDIHTYIYIYIPHFPMLFSMFFFSYVSSRLGCSPPSISSGTPPGAAQGSAQRGAPQQQRWLECCVTAGSPKMDGWYWFIREHPIGMDDFGGRKPPNDWNTKV